MSYWCYFTDTMNEDVKQKITEECVITLPCKPEIAPGDKIILYSKGKFTGYMESIDRVKSNLRENGNPKVPVFMDNIYNVHKLRINLYRLTVKGFRKAEVFAGNEQFRNGFEKHLKRGEYIALIGIDLGGYIIKYIQDHPEVVKEKKVVEKIKPVIVEEFNKPSCHIIPILIIPCKDIKKELKKYDGTSRIQVLLNHVLSCRVCDVTNNNSRVTIASIIDRIKTYYRMANPVEVASLLKRYQSLSYYDAGKNRLIKIVDTINMYYGCYFLIAKLDGAC